MNIIFRVDSSRELGAGHVMRCSALADALLERENKIWFVSQKYDGNLTCFLKNKGYPVIEISSRDDADGTGSVLKEIGMTIDWLIVDHYGLDKNWEIQMRSLVKKIMVVDDKADRFHDCDLLLDQNFQDEIHRRYEPLIPKHALKLLGPKYAMLRPEFEKHRAFMKRDFTKINRIFVCFGGSDPTNETEKVIRALFEMNHKDIKIDVVLGVLNPYRESIEKLCFQMNNVHCFFDPKSVAKLMAKADLAIGAPGSMTWERCCLGLPTIAIVIADNQIPISKTLSQVHVIDNLGWYDTVTISMIQERIQYYMKTPKELKAMSEKAYEFVDGLGTQRVVEALNL